MDERTKTNQLGNYIEIDQKFKENHMGKVYKWSLHDFGFWTRSRVTTWMTKAFPGVKVTQIPNDDESRDTAPPDFKTALDYAQKEAQTDEEMSLLTFASNTLRTRLSDPKKPDTLRLSGAHFFFKIGENQFCLRPTTLEEGRGKPFLVRILAIAPNDEEQPTLVNHMITDTLDDKFYNFLQNPTIPLLVGPGI